MTSLIPLFKNKVYHNDPIFEDAKVVYSAYNNGLDETFGSRFTDIAAINSLEAEDVKIFEDNDNISLNKGGLEHVDAIVVGSNDLPSDVMEKIQGSDAIVQEYMGVEEQLQATIELYSTLLGEDEE